MPFNLAPNKVYLGDGAYAEFDGFAVILTTDNGITTTNRIVLEPSVLDALTNYVKKLKKGSRATENTGQ